MTYLSPHSEVLGLPSDDLLPAGDFLDDTKLFGHYNDFDGFPLSPVIPYQDHSYEIIQENKAKRECEGLKLRLRMSNSICLGPGSVGSSPSEATSDSDITNVEDFLNLPTNDYVTLEESKQAHSYIAPSPAYSLSSGSTDTGPSPVHTSFSPRTAGPPKRKISLSASPSSSKRAGQPCKVTPTEKGKVIEIPEDGSSPGSAPPPSQRGVMKKYNAQNELLLQSREKEVIEVEKRESKLKQGAVIGSMERGPRMFGVRYGPCDRPHLEQEKAEVEEEEEVKVTKTSEPNASSSYQSTAQSKTAVPGGVQKSMVMNQQMKLNANSRVHKLPSYQHTTIQTRGDKGDSPRQWSCPVPKAKIELPPYRPHKSLSKSAGKCKRSAAANKSIIDMFYQKHLFCSANKPLFESDPEILKLSDTYQLMLNTYMSLEAQRVTAIKDLDKLENLKTAAKKRPYKFIKQLQKGELVFPLRQKVAKVPQVQLSYRNKEIDICTFKAPSGQMVSRHTEEFTNKTRLKKEEY